MIRKFLYGSLLGAVSATAFATVNVNTAQQSELQSTRGLDKFKAKQIIEYRNQHGPYQSLDDLAKVIGNDSAGKVADQVAFTGDAYVAPPRVKGADKRGADKRGADKKSAK